MVTLKEFLQRLSKTRDVRWHHNQIDRIAGSADAAVLYEYALSLETDRVPADTPKWACESLFSQIQRSLALSPGRLQLETFFRIATLERKRTLQAVQDPEEFRRSLASMIAAAHPIEEIAQAFTDFQSFIQHRELLACLLYEAVARGLEVQRFPILVDFAAGMKAQNHPLSVLPLRLLPIESNSPQWLPRYGSSITSINFPSIVPGDDSSGAPVTVIEVTDEATVRVIASAVIPWTQSSNGVCEARSFRLAAPTSPEQIGAVMLQSLGLQCLEAAESISVRPLSPADALISLFTAAAHGGAYGGQLHAAYGRLAAWTSLGGLIGLTNHTDLMQTEQQALASSWYTFDGDSTWFHRIAWDLGIMALSPDGQTLSILAATDTD